MNTEVTGGIPVTVIKTAMFSPILPYYAIRVIIDIIRFWETAHLPPPVSQLQHLLLTHTA